MAVSPSPLLIETDGNDENLYTATANANGDSYRYKRPIVGISTVGGDKLGSDHLLALSGNAYAVSWHEQRRKRPSLPIHSLR